MGGEHINAVRDNNNFMNRFYTNLIRDLFTLKESNDLNFSMVENTKIITILLGLRTSIEIYCFFMLILCHSHDMFSSVLYDIKRLHLRGTYIAL